jgi:hypothetical protein
LGARADPSAEPRAIARRAVAVEDDEAARHVQLEIERQGDPSLEALGLVEGGTLLLWDRQHVGAVAELQAYAGTPELRPRFFYITHLFLDTATGSDGSDDGAEDEEHEGRESLAHTNSQEVQQPLPVERHELTIVLPACSTIDTLAAAIEARSGLPPANQLLLDTASVRPRASSPLKLKGCVHCGYASTSMHGS